MTLFCNHQIIFIGSAYMYAIYYKNSIPYHRDNNVDFLRPKFSKIMRGRVDHVYIHIYYLEQNINIIIQAFPDVGREVNMSKTETMIWNCKGNCTESFIKIQYVKFINTKCFKCIGELISYNKYTTGDEQTEHRTECSTDSFP